MGLSAYYGLDDGFAQFALVILASASFALLMGAVCVRTRGLYFIMEQANRIYSRSLLQHNLETTAARHPGTQIFLIQPPPRGTPLFGPSMGFAASHAALRYGYTATKAWLATHGAELARRIARVPLSTIA